MVCPARAERLFHHIPLVLKYEVLRQVFNEKSVSKIIFHSRCQHPFYKEVLNFPENALSYVPFGVETDYFKPEPVSNEDYIYAAGEFRDFNTLLSVYEKWHDRLPELRIRSALPRPRRLPPKVRWLPRVPISIFKDEVLRAKLVIVSLHRTLRSTGIMTLLQSMALGKAVLVSKVPPVYDYVVDGKTALYYMPYNPEDLFRKISFLLNDEELVANLGREARRVVEKYFNLENMGKGLWNCVFTLLKNIK